MFVEKSDERIQLAGSYIRELKRGNLWRKYRQLSLTSQRKIGIWFQKNQIKKFPLD